MHHHVLRLNLSIAFGMSKCSPNSSLLAKRLYIFNIVVGEVAELLNHILLCVRIFVGTNVNHLTTEHWILTLKILFEQAINKLIGLRIEKVEVIHSIFLRTYFWLVMSKGKRVGRHVNFGNDIDAILLGKLLEFNKLGLSIMSVLGCKSRISITFKAESSLRLIPIAIKELAETIIVEMNLQSVHFIIRHHLDKRAQIRHRDKLSATIHHKATQAIFGHINSNAFR